MYQSVRTSKQNLPGLSAWRCLLLLVLLSLPRSYADEGTTIGNIVVSQGMVKLDQAAGNARPGVLFDGGLIKTGSASWAMVELYDATRMVLGPDTAVKVALKTQKNLHYLNLDLDTGLLRIVTALACNRSIDDCVIGTPYGNLHLFDARADIWLCEDDCAADATLDLPTTGMPSGRVIYIKGSLYRVDNFHTYRRVLPDDAIYLSDELLAGRDSCAVIAFNDGSILSLSAGQQVNASDPAQRQGAGRCKDWQAPEDGLDFRAMFATQDSSRLSHGVFVRVIDGHVRLGDGAEALGIGRGETAYMGNGRPLRISSWPRQAVLDSAPDPYFMSRRGP